MSSQPSETSFSYISQPSETSFSSVDPTSGNTFIGISSTSDESISTSTNLPETTTVSLSDIAVAPTSSIHSADTTASGASPIGTAVCDDPLTQIPDPADPSNCICDTDLVAGLPLPGGLLNCVIPASCDLTSTILDPIDPTLCQCISSTTQIQDPFNLSSCICRTGLTEGVPPIGGLLNCVAPAVCNSLSAVLDNVDPTICNCLDITTQIIDPANPTQCICTTGLTAGIPLVGGLLNCVAPIVCNALNAVLDPIDPTICDCLDITTQIIDPSNPSQCTCASGLTAGVPLIGGLLNCVAPI
ncbi:hypothetical protein IFR04_012902, partial [Cadophora malorum]